MILTTYIVFKYYIHNWYNYCYKTCEMCILIIEVPQNFTWNVLCLKNYDHGNVRFEVLMEGSVKFDLILRSHTVAVVWFILKFWRNLLPPVCRVEQNFYTLKEEALHSSNTWYVYTKLHITTSRKIVTFNLAVIDSLLCWWQVCCRGQLY